MNTTATHVRITNGGTPEFIGQREALDEVNAAMMGETKKQVRRMSTDQGGRAATIEYRDGRKVTIRPATDADQPAPAPQEERHVTPLAGGKVHLDSPGMPKFPLCRTGSQASAGTRYRYTEQAVDCANCCEQQRRRALRATRLAANS